MSLNPKKWFWIVYKGFRWQIFYICYLIIATKCCDYCFYFFIFKGTNKDRRLFLLLKLQFF